MANPETPISKNATRNSKNNWIPVLLLSSMIVILAVLYLVNEWHSGKQHSIECGDGPRYTIDIRQFETQYSAYSLELAASVGTRGKLSAKLTPVQLQTLTEATQNATDFRKYLVNGFNGCAITKAQYALSGDRYQSLDILAREINGLSQKQSLSSTETIKLNGLIDQFGNLAQNLGEKAQGSK